jgi:hypothetical protein
LIDELGIENDVYFVTRSITGVDAISLLMSGARGLVEMEPLGSCWAMQEIIHGVREPEKKLNRLLIGSPYHKLKSLIEMANGRWQLPESHWSLLLALAEIPLLKLPIPNKKRQNSDQDTKETSDTTQEGIRPARGKNKPTQNQIADEIAEWVTVTGYSVSGSTSRKLPLLLNLIMDELDVDSSEQTQDIELSGKRRMLRGEEMFELPYLPTYVRLLDFPPRLLPIRGLDQSQLAARLYKGLRGIEIVSTSTHENVIVAHVTLPRPGCFISPSLTSGEP